VPQGVRRYEQEIDLRTGVATFSNSSSYLLRAA
jgi:hypothetical protein